MKSLGLVLSLLVITACSTTTNKKVDAGDLNVRVTSKLEADLEVDTSKKVSGKAFHTKLFGLINLKTSTHYADGVNYGGGNNSGFSFFSGGIVEEAKSAAAYNALNQAKADVIVVPQYVIKVNSWFFGAYKEVTAVVSGYSAKIRSLKKDHTPVAAPIAKN